MKTADCILQQVIIRNGFWSEIRETVRREGIPYQWKALNDQVEGAEPSYCMRNFRVAAGKEPGKHGGLVFQDSDVAKWLEGVAYTLSWHPDAVLERTADSAIDDIVAAQQPDGYLNTYYTINGLDKRWTNLMDNHELYCAGHMIEAAVAYYKTTSKRKLLDAMLRYVDYIDSMFGGEEGKLKGYPGHPVIEMALMRLYELTQNERHLKMAQFFIKQRGQSPLYFEQESIDNNRESEWLQGPLKFAYYQADKPVYEQKDAVGHAVRAAYLFSGMVDVARVKNDSLLQKTCESMWRSIVERRMYITGAIGSSAHGEAFTFDYDLPNDTAYGETCASIAMVFLAGRMLKTRICGTYADVMERALYNSVLSGMQLDGKSFFYVNPLEVLPEACEKDERKKHVKAQRQPWFSCACCPPNFIRLIASLENYAFSADDQSLFIHTYLNSDVSCMVNGTGVKVRMETDYPWNGNVKLTLSLDEPASFELALHIPGWCKHYGIKVNGEAVRSDSKDGYHRMRKEWKHQDTVELTLSMPVTIVRANPRVYEDVGKVAVTRGPIVYCLEEADNGPDLHLIRLQGVTAEDFKVSYHPDLLGGVAALSSPAIRETCDGWDENTLYADDGEGRMENVTLQWIPYFAWANREAGEMRVWVRE